MRILIKAVIISVVERKGNISHKNWTKSLQHFPVFSENKMEEALQGMYSAFDKEHMY